MCPSEQKEETEQGHRDTGITSFAISLAVKAIFLLIAKRELKCGTKTWEVMFLSERWIRLSEKNLVQIKRLEEAKARDRLELGSSLLFLLSALRKSVFGWIQWVNNLKIMARFTQEDPEKMNKKLSDFTRSFIEYDIEATKLGVEKGLKPGKEVKKKRGWQFYV